MQNHNFINQEVFKSQPAQLFYETRCNLQKSLFHFFRTIMVWDFSF
uniref:Uncharacterized protein n=1 Tax=viral metagenome TaxID=1070528 RepID=A0A6C0I5A1_9ZZZZ